MDTQDSQSDRDSVGTVVIVESGVEDEGYVSESSGLDASDPEDTGLQLDDSNNNRRNQFRPRPGGKQGTNSYQLRQYAEATLGGGSLRKIVKLPEGEDENEWFAVNMVDFYNQINLLYGAITEFCSPQSCPEMKATDEYAGDRPLLASHINTLLTLIKSGSSIYGRTARTISARPRWPRRPTSSSS